MGKLERIRVRRPSVLLLIDVKPASGGPRIIVPIPIAAITVLVETIGSWAPALKRLGVRLPKRISRHLEQHTRVAATKIPVNINAGEGAKRWDGGSVVESALGAVEALWRELISYGSWDFVNVKSSSGDRVVIRFV